VDIKIHFYSYFKDLTGCETTVVSIPEGTVLSEVHETLMAKFPKLAAMKKSTLIAVGVNYELPGHILREGEEVSLFPPVQGG